jgi:phosphoribosylformylglycinamidine synthase
MKARVHVFFKPNVFDPQGTTVCQSLQSLGFNKVSTVRIGKSIDLDLNVNSKEEAKLQIDKMCEKLLVNAVIESYEIQWKDTP